MRNQAPIFWLLLILSCFAGCGTKKLTQAPDGAIDFAYPFAVNSPLKRQDIDTHSFYLTMRDGTRIAVDLHLPKQLPKCEKLPTILRTTRYLRSVEIWPIFRSLAGWPKKDMPRFFVANGYAWVDVDARGSGASFGTRIGPSGPEEVKDMGEVVDWILAQPWSNGLVGATGVSYEGTTAEMLAVNQHPAVKAVVPRFSYFDPAIDIARPGGIRLASFTEVWSKLNRDLDANRVGTTFLQRLVVQGINPVDDPMGRISLYAAVGSHGDNWDPDEAARAQPLPYGPWPPEPSLTSKDFGPVGNLAAMRASGTAIYSYGGWFDGAYPRAAIKRFLAFYTEGSQHRLIIGPWNHGATWHSSPHVQQRTGFDQAKELLRFFDHHLRDRDTGIGDDPPIRYYTMGAEVWRTAHQWPPKGTTTKTYYLNRDLSLSKDLPIRPGQDAYQVSSRTGTGKKTRWDTLIGRKPVRYPQRHRRDRKLLVYESEPLGADMEVTGHPVITLYLATTDSRSDFYVYLEDVAGPNKVHYVTEGVLRGDFHRTDPKRPAYLPMVPHHPFRKREPIKAGEITKITFDLLPTSYLFRQGHRIRIAIAGADKHHFEAAGATPKWTLHWSEVNPSQIILPVIQR